MIKNAKVAFFLFCDIITTQMGGIVKNINRMINKIIVEITLLIVLCLISFVTFSQHTLDGIVNDFKYTDIDIIEERNSLGINSFTDDSQIKLAVSNLSNTSEKYKLILTSDSNLALYEDFLKIKINDSEYMLKDLKIADNYFLIDEGDMKANVKEIDLYFAVDEEYNDKINNKLSLQFINDLNI